jgi:EAL domain-containing protein (putative c-di-GMP-specific phosphodiesterase class I)
MYRAKELGGARVEVFDSVLRSEVVARLDTERSLRRAIEREQLRVYYQPVVELGTGRTVSYEALVRWQHPTRGLIGPDEFVDVAEETGLITPLTTWVLEQVCRDLVAGPRLDGASVSVNLSGRQLTRPDLIPSLRRILGSAGVEPERLGLEITESVLLTDVAASSAALRSLIELGVVVALDDFGTGYSSLAYLRQFPFDYLKVDEAFVAGLGIHSSDDAILAATVQMARGLGMRGVVAEGVENHQQMLRARQLGCTYAQGYYFAAPAPLELLGAPDGHRLAPVTAAASGA